MQDGVDPASIILYGESLGSGVAVRLAYNADFRAPYFDEIFSATSEKRLRPDT